MTEKPVATSITDVRVIVWQIKSGGEHQQFNKDRWQSRLFTFDLFSIILQKNTTKQSMGSQLKKKKKENKGVFCVKHWKVFVTANILHLIKLDLRDQVKRNLRWAGEGVVMTTEEWNNASGCSVQFMTTTPDIETWTRNSVSTKICLVNSRSDVKEILNWPLL